jgi:hypothetical protein
MKMAFSGGFVSPPDRRPPELREPRIAAIKQAGE